MNSAETLLKQATESDGKQRREAFLKLVASEDWELALTEQVIAAQGYAIRDDSFPDLITARAAAPIIASDEDKIHRVLELLGSLFTPELLGAMARHMGPGLVDHALAHLRTAHGERADLLLQHLQIAHRGWVTHPSARRIIRKGLREHGATRFMILDNLAEAGNLDQFLPELRDHAPHYLEEWSAMGKSGIMDESLVHQGLASFRNGPESLAYLLRLDPVPEAVGPRIMAAALPDWLLDALEVAIVEKLDHPFLLPLAELGIRQGGRQLAAASAWLGATRISHDLLSCLTKQLVREDGHERLDDLLWVRRKASSPDRAMEHGRRGVVPDLLDAAALVRQYRGEDARVLTREILSEPYLVMMEPVLRPLCAVNSRAASEVMEQAQIGDPGPAELARQALKWPDVFWQYDIGDEPTMQ